MSLLKTRSAPRSASQMLPPGPKGHPLFGVMDEFHRDTVGLFLRLRAYGDVSNMRFGPFPVFILSSPDVIHQAIVKDADKFHKQSATKSVMGPVVGEGLFTSDGEFWKRQRRLASPAFHTRRIGGYAETISRLAEQHADSLRDGETVQMDATMTHLTMQIISRVLFDADVSGEAHEIGEIIAELLHLMDIKFDSLFPIPYSIPTPRNRRFNRLVARLNTLIQGFIDERRKTGKDNGDLLSMLLLAQDEEGSTGGMTDKQVRDEAMTMFGAGHETTAATMMWVWALLDQHPDVEARLQAEWAAVLGGRTPAFDDLPNLRYTEQVIKETMRLYPPAWGFGREAIEDVEIGGYTLKKGQNMMVNVVGIHRDARYWREPDRFDPDRFSPEREAEIVKYAYLPFGGGPRVCIGNAFAMMEAKLMLATLGQRFTFRLAPGERVEPARKFTLKPKHGLKMTAHARETHPAQPPDAAQPDIAPEVQPELQPALQPA